MKKSVKRFLCMGICIAMSFVTLAGCAGKPASTTTSAAKSTATSTNPADIPMDQRPVIRMFMGDSGLAIPTGANIDPSDNEYIRVVEDYAGVNLEVVVPAYSDFASQFNLMMSSGDLPDIIHTWLIDDAYKYGDQGAFEDLKPYYDKSELVQSLVSPEAFETTKSSSGKYYRIPQTNTSAREGYGNWIRYDLLKEYNGGEFPTDVEGYVDFLRWVKKTYPDSIPLTARSTQTKIFLYGELFFKWYGAMPQSYNVVDGKVVSTFTLPEYRAAVELYRQLYSEGILDKEFATTDATNYGTKLNTRNVAMGTDLPANMVAGNMTTVMNEETKNLYRIATPELTKYPDAVKDPIYTKALKSPPAGIHGVYMSAASKNKDLAWKVIEGFCSPELREKIAWGTEGVEYTVKDGNRIVNSDVMYHENRRWCKQLLILQGFASDAPVTEAISLERLGKEKYDFQAKQLEVMQAETEERGPAIIDVYRYTGGLISTPVALKEKEAEYDAFTAEATVGAITGQISMEEFDKRVEKYKQQYGFVDEEWTKLLNEKKDYLVSVGCTEAAR